MKRAERLQAITEMLRRTGTQGCTAERLAREFEVSVRTIKRDLETLERSGLPVWSRTGPGGGYGLSEASSLPPVNLSATQAVSLLAAVAASAGGPYADAARSASLKVMDVLDPSTQRRAVDLAERIWVDDPKVAPRRIMSAVEQSMQEQTVVRIGYTDREGRGTDRDVEPVLFASSHGRWYLVGWCRLRDDMRWFAMGRIDRAVTTRLECTGHRVDEVGEAPETAAPVLVEYD